MAEPLAVIADVESAWRELTPEEQAPAQHALVLASALVRTEVSGLDVRVAEGSLDPELVAHVVAAVVVRALRNPDNARSKSQTAGPFTTYVQWDAVMATMTLLPAERRVLAPATGRAAGIGTMRVHAGLGWGPW